MKIKFLIIALFIVFWISCDEEPEFNSFDYNVAKEFRMNEQYVANDLALIFTIDEISDSRCPSGAYCIWQGEARIKIVVERPAADTLELSTYDCLSASTGNYGFQLLDVSPFPAINSEINIEDYRVKMKITH